MSNILLISATKLEHHEEELFGIPIHIVGVGKVNAAVNTYRLVQQYKPEYVINFGSCGNLKNHNVGQVLEIGEIYDDFYGCVVPEHDPIIVSDSDIKLFTTDTFYDKFATYSNSYHQNINKCDLVDMEGYSIAKVCKEENISLSLYKWVSDDGSTKDWEANAAVGYENFKIKFKKWLEQQK
jgi:adenosylhomocysteine nucleosidase